MDSLKDKVTVITGRNNDFRIITGAASGFGRCTALLFAKYGAPVVLADINFSGAESVADECVGVGLTKEQVSTVKCDITKDADRKFLIKKCVEDFGRLDVLVNNAGIYRMKSLLDATPEMYDLLMNVNLKAHVLLTQIAAPYLKMSKGCIVNLSSVVSKEAVPTAGVYCLSKAGMDCFTKMLALELAEFGVRVNSVRPSTMHTNLYDVDFGQNITDVMKKEVFEHPLGRMGLPEEVAKAIAFLASDMSSYSTGNFFYVDGGRHCIGAKYNPYLKQ